MTDGPTYSIDWYKAQATGGQEGKAMTREEAADRFCKSCVELHKSRAMLDAATRLHEEGERERARAEATLKEMTAAQASPDYRPDQAGVQASRNAAILFAQSIVKHAATEVAKREAEARHGAATKETNHRLSILVGTVGQ